MPDLPTLDVTKAQKTRILAAFGGEEEYRQWLTGQVRDAVRQDHLQFLEEAIAVAREEALQELEADLPGEGEAEKTPMLPPEVILPPEPVTPEVAEQQRREREGKVREEGARLLRGREAAMARRAERMAARQAAQAPANSE